MKRKKDVKSVNIKHILLLSFKEILSKSFAKVLLFDFLTLISFFIIISGFSFLALTAEQDMKSMVPFAKSTYDMLEKTKTNNWNGDFEAARASVHELKLRTAIIVAKVVGSILFAFLLFIAVFSYLQSTVWKILLKNRLSSIKIIRFGLCIAVFSILSLTAYLLVLIIFKQPLSVILLLLLTIILRHFTLVFSSGYFHLNTIKEIYNYLRTSLFSKRSVVILLSCGAIYIILILTSIILVNYNPGFLLLMIISWLVYFSWSKVYVKLNLVDSNV